MKTAEDYWYEYSHESIVEGLRAITEANFKQAIRLCQQELMDQIEYQNKAAKEDHDKIKKLEFDLKQERNRAIDEVKQGVDLLYERDCSDGVGYKELLKLLESLKH